MRPDLAGLARVQPSTVTLVFGLFQRAVGIYCILLGMSYWVRLIGLYEGALWRYDLMPPHWRVAAVALAILFPIAGSGLWMVASWGPVVWFICAATEFVMYAVFPEKFGWDVSVLVFHGLVGLIYVAFRMVIYLQSRAET